MAKHRAILGPAGSGKTTRVRELANDGTLLTSTTGVSAVNLSDRATTVHSALGFYDRESFEYQRAHGKFPRLLSKAGCTTLVIDEVSMLQAYQLDGILEGADDAGVQVIFTGDFCQLPPVPEKNPTTGKSLPFQFAFEGQSWPQVEVESLTTIHRQSDPAFLTALRSLREGAPQVEAFRPCCESEFDEDFVGTTIFALRRNVEAFNTRRLAQLQARPVIYNPTRVGQQHPDWRDIGAVTIKAGARVMVTRNLWVADADPLAVNGDMGEVAECGDRSVTITLDRTQQPIVLSPIRQCWYAPGTEAKARKTYDDMIAASKGEVAAMQAKHTILDAGTLGSIRYMPMRIAYALTVHKTQGLTLDRAQVSLFEPFMKQPAMLYVALSRVRSLDGLRLIGGLRRLADWCTTHPKVHCYI